MPKSKLLVAFERVRDEFNACSKGGDYKDKLTGLFYKDVIISKVDDSTPVQGRTAFAGVDEVIKYLEDTQTNKFPKFNQSTKSGEETPEETPPDSDSNASVVFAQVSGLGNYWDKKSDKDAGKQGLYVRYFFTFRRTDLASDWKLTSASLAKTV